MGLPKEIWTNILNDVIAKPTTKELWKKITLTLAKAQMITVLNNYAKEANFFGGHKNRAISFASAVRESSTAEALSFLVTEQKELAINGSKKQLGDEKHKKPLSNKTLDGYQRIISVWAKRFHSPESSVPVNSSISNKR